MKYLLIVLMFVGLLSCKKKQECWKCKYNCAATVLNRDTTICDPNFDPNNGQFIDSRGNDCTTFQCTKD